MTGITIEKKNGCSLCNSLFAENQFYLNYMKVSHNRINIYLRELCLPGIMLWNINDLVFVCIELFKSFFKKKKITKDFRQTEIVSALYSGIKSVQCALFLQVTVRILDLAGVDLRL